ncbi:MAG: hypothetical protein LBL36_05625, partial [Clostridiales Family XIII bacterium]|nr:hypothetical protein [Clostridiales Family XIII bacterium]
MYTQIFHGLKTAGALLTAAVLLWLLAGMLTPVHAAAAEDALTDHIPVTLRVVESAPFVPPFTGDISSGLPSAEGNELAFARAASSALPSTGDMPAGIPPLAVALLLLCVVTATFIIYIAYRRKTQGPPKSSALMMLG